MPRYDLVIKVDDGWGDRGGDCDGGEGGRWSGVERSGADEADEAERSEVEQSGAEWSGAKRSCNQPVHSFLPNLAQLSDLDERCVRK